MSDLEGILNGVEPEEVQTPEPVEPEAEPQQTEPEAAEQPEVEAQPEPQPEPEKQPEHTVPVRVVQELREKLRALEEAQRQPPQEPVKVPDVFEDQEGFTAHIQRQIQDGIRRVTMEQSKRDAEREFGADTIKEVVEYFDQHPQKSHDFLNEPSPYHAAVKYVEAQKLVQEIGNDPSQYKTKLEAEIRAQIKAEQAAEQVKAMAAKVPASLANVNGASGGQKDPGWNGPADLDSLLK